ncbi:hypothetical protein [Microvirga antarctica]|uniref:hypothetical protein n=1 Tax=Microvirga antarctica TaxID=2819233 RepID=UPI001B308D35|nr:hypothetical protein [Microvirga antarctica]
MREQFNSVQQTNRLTPLESKRGQAPDAKVFAWFYGSDPEADALVVSAAVRRFGAAAFSEKALAFIVGEQIAAERHRQRVQRQNREQRPCCEAAR